MKKTLNENMIISKKVKKKKIEAQFLTNKILKKKIKKKLKKSDHVHLGQHAKYMLWL
jgi:hypothetical protein